MILGSEIFDISFLRRLRHLNRRRLRKVICGCRIEYLKGRFKSELCLGLGLACASGGISLRREFARDGRSVVPWKN